MSCWQLLSLSSNIAITCKVQWSAFELILSTSSLPLKLRIQKDNWHIGLNAVALSRRPSDNYFKWCEGWKFQKQALFVHVGVQTAMHVPNQDIEQPANCQGPVGDHCVTLK